MELKPHYVSDRFPLFLSPYGTPLLDKVESSTYSPGLLAYVLVYIAIRPTGSNMASADEQLKRLTDPSLLDKIDGLRELNISEYIPLPQVNS